MKNTTKLYDMAGKELATHCTGFLLEPDGSAVVVETGFSGLVVKAERVDSHREAVLVSDSMARMYGAQYRGALQY